MAKSKVYFVPVSERDKSETVADKLKALIDKSCVLSFSSDRAHEIAVKMHFGEEGNTGFVKPEFVRIICEELKKNGAYSFVADTNTLYKGRRTNSKEHLLLAAEHGFTEEKLGAKVIVPDDSLPESTVNISVNLRFIKNASLMRLFIESGAIVAVSHFKGHLMTGFGGALKNLGMGCASRSGKLAQHSGVSPVVYADKCTGCGECEKSCPVKAIDIRGYKSVIDGFKCIGCATCIGVCPFAAIDVDWGSGASTMIDKMIEYTYSIMKGKSGKLAFFNFAVKITKECDCLAKDDPRISPDIGILASNDPVSIDKASLDLVKAACGRNIFQELHPHRDCMRQLNYAYELGIGNLDYELISLNA